MHQTLSRRERQIMDALYRHGGGATAADVWPDCRALRRTRQCARSCEIGPLRRRDTSCTRRRAIATCTCPTVPRHSARRSALRHLVETFFDGLRAKVVAALLGTDADNSRQMNSNASRRWCAAHVRRRHDRHVRRRALRIIGRVADWKWLVFGYVASVEWGPSALSRTAGCCYSAP